MNDFTEISVKTKKKKQTRTRQSNKNPIISKWRVTHILPEKNLAPGILKLHYIQ
jgi:hypothetical protein